MQRMMRIVETMQQEPATFDAIYFFVIVELSGFFELAQ